MDLVIKTNKGLYCPPGGFYLDPHRAVKTAVITHAHSDHAISGHSQVIATAATINLMQLRGNKFTTKIPLAYGDQIVVNGVGISLHPAGHIWGSAQVRLEYKGIVWVYTGDYKVTSDGISVAYEQLTCDVLITESTFGLPIFYWKDDSDIRQEFIDWESENRSQGVTRIVVGYSLGKSQRLIKLFNPQNAYIHAEIYAVNELLIQAGIDLPRLNQLPQSYLQVKGATIFVPPNALRSAQLAKLMPYSIAYASGWMALPSMQKRVQADHSFVISDHADWPGLTKAVLASKAKCVLTLHGFSTEFAEYIEQVHGVISRPLERSVEHED